MTLLIWLLCTAFELLVLAAGAGILHLIYGGFWMKFFGLCVGYGFGEWIRANWLIAKEVKEKL